MDLLTIHIGALTVASLVLVSRGQQNFPEFPEGPIDITCKADTCPPTATCRQKETYVYCECPYGKTGMTCEEDDPCLPRLSGCPEGALCYGQCNPNVVCLGATGIPQCSGCVTGWTGQNCRVDVNECIEIPGICLNGGQCVNLLGDFSCDCPSGWVGKDCFCKKGTACDVPGVNTKDQYSGVIDINTDLDLKNTTPNTGADTDPNNSAQTTTVSSSLIACVSLVILKLL